MTTVKGRRSPLAYRADSRFLRGRARPGAAKTKRGGLFWAGNSDVLSALAPYGRAWGGVFANAEYVEGDWSAKGPAFKGAGDRARSRGLPSTRDAGRAMRLLRCDPRSCRRKRDSRFTDGQIFLEKRGGTVFQPGIRPADERPESPVSGRRRGGAAQTVTIHQERSSAGRPISLAMGAVFVKLVWRALSQVRSDPDEGDPARQLGAGVSAGPPAALHSK